MVKLEIWKSEDFILEERFHEMNLCSSNQTWSLFSSRWKMERREKKIVQIVLTIVIIWSFCANISIFIESRDLTACSSRAYRSTI